MKRFKNWILNLVFILVLIVPLISLLNQGLPFTHDGRDHVARIANFYQSLSEGIIIPRWAGNLNWGYGHPIPMFLYPLPSYTASLFHLIGFNFIDSTKLVFALGFALSGYFMYLWLSQFLRREEAIFGGVLYVYAPYRFVDLYVRGAIGENFAFIFLPLILLFLYKLYKKQNVFNFSLLSISLAFLILAHNALSLIFLPFLFFYTVFLWSRLKFKKSYLIYSLTSIMLGFLLSAFFWLPALLEGKYTLRNILTSGTYIRRFVDFNSLIYGPWNYGQSGEFTVQLGPIHWISFLVSFIALFYFKLKKKNNFWLVLAGIIYTIVGIFLMLIESNFIWEKIMILQNFQFPWRLLAIPVFSMSLLGALTVSILKERVRKKVIFGLIAVLFLLSISYMKPKGYLIKPESFYTGVFESTTDTGESSPIWSVRFMEKKPATPIQVIEGRGEVKEVIHKTNYRVYEFEGINSARLLVNTLYFPNWTIYVDGKKEPTQFQDPKYRGLMTFYVTGRNHKIEAVFENTKVRTYSDIISLISLLFIVSLISYKIIKR